ncbi:MAG: hypothetical protein LWW95_09955, partial [Candidatus Desulfofervidus auxilii]|nr:hypothetical protein [Candidatus Desulfofervidus auxilii]
KCPGNFRRKRRKFNVNACADKYLRREIEVLKPSLIICVGGMASSWILRNYEDSLHPTLRVKDWRERLWLQILGNITSIQIGGWTAKIVFLFHPSERSGIGWFIDRKQKNIIEKLVEEYKII